jgi:NTE family protein
MFILYRTEDISTFHLTLERLKEADIVIRPDVKKISWANFDNAKEIIQTGEIATKEKIEEIKNLYYRNSYLLTIERFFKKLKAESQSKYK